MPELPSPDEMPRTPEPLPELSSIGSLADRAGIDVSEVPEEAPDEAGNLSALRGRTEEVSEDIVESQSPEETMETEEQSPDAIEAKEETA